MRRKQPLYLTARAAARAARRKEAPQQHSVRAAAAARAQAQQHFAPSAPGARAARRNSVGKTVRTPQADKQGKAVRAAHPCGRHGMSRA